jgi:hypothetical protein
MRRRRVVLRKADVFLNIGIGGQTPFLTHFLGTKRANAVGDRFAGRESAGEPTCFHSDATAPSALVNHTKPLYTMC